MALAIPEYDNDAIKDIEPIGNVTERSFGNNLQQHFNGKDAGEDYIAGLHNGRQFLRLIVILDAHGQCIDEYGQQDALLEVLVLHQTFDIPTYKAADAHHAAIDGNDKTQSRRTWTAPIVQGRECILIEIIAAGIVLHVVAGGGCRGMVATMMLQRVAPLPVIVATLTIVIVIVVVVAVIAMCILACALTTALLSLCMLCHGHSSRNGSQLEASR